MFFQLKKTFFFAFRGSTTRHLQCWVGPMTANEQFFKSSLRTIYKAHYEDNFDIIFDFLLFYMFNSRPASPEDVLISFSNYFE